MPGRTLLFGYGSLVNKKSAEQTIGREIERLEAATIRGWRRRWSLLRDNPYCERTFALEDDGRVPDWLLSLNIERTGNPDDEVNGVVLEIAEADVPALDVREIRYRREALATESGLSVITYVGNHHNTATVTPAGALILSTYLEVVEAGFEALGAGELDRFKATTGRPPVPVIAGRLVRHDGHPASPSQW